MLRSKFYSIVICFLAVCVLSAFSATPAIPVYLKISHKEIFASSANYAFETDTRMNPVSANFVKKYIQSNEDNLELIKGKSNKTFRLIDLVLKKYKLPLELKYLAVVESELKPTAVSKVGAVGTWQLMPETAKILGLKITVAEDERKSTSKSTKAAALYLRDLHTEFKDWLLVLAAYNCGPGPIYTAMKKSGSKNFWVLQKYLPSESREHVHKFIATHQFFETNPPVDAINEWKFMAFR